MYEAKEKIQETMENLANQPIQEGHWTKKIENQTAKIPSVAFLSLALASVAVSLGFKAVNKKSVTSTFVGLWAPTFLLLGIYNKLVKLEGNDRYNRA